MPTSLFISCFKMDSSNIFQKRKHLVLDSNASAGADRVLATAASSNQMWTIASEIKFSGTSRPADQF